METVFQNIPQPGRVFLGIIGGVVRTGCTILVQCIFQVGSYIGCTIFCVCNQVAAVNPEGFTVTCSQQLQTEQRRCDSSVLLAVLIIIADSVRASQIPARVYINCGICTVLAPCSSSRISTCTHCAEHGHDHCNNQKHCSKSLELSFLHSHVPPLPFILKSKKSWSSYILSIPYSGYGYSFGYSWRFFIQKMLIFFKPEPFCICNSCVSQLYPPAVSLLS